MVTDIYYFDKPTIGYCPKCDVYAIYMEERGLHCPECKTQNVSYFEWNGEGPFPEEV